MDSYEKKYKEAINRAKAMVKVANSQEEIYNSVITIFPELKESEDKMIREYLIRYIDNTMKSSELKSKLLAWLENIPYTIDREKREGFHLGYKAGLEKQGEKSLTVDIESMIEAYEQRLINQGNGVRNSPIVNMCVAAFKHGVENTLDELHLKQGETSPILSNSSNIGKDEQKPTIEMKSAEESLGIDSETYNKIVDECIYGEQKHDTDFSDLRTWKYIVDAVWTEKEGIGQYLDSPFTEEVAKKLQKRFGNIEQKSQRMVSAEAKEAMYDKPADWSEEDEKMIQDIISDIAIAQEQVYCKSRCEDEINWLKSLKQRIGGKL